MRAIFSSRRVVGCSLQSLKMPSFSHRHLLPFGLSATRVVPSLVSRSENIHGFFFASTLRNTHLELKSGNLLDSRVGFEPWVFTGFQKRGWKSWFNGGHGVVFGLIIANAAVFTMYKVSDKQWVAKNFMLSLYSFTAGRIHTLITSGFCHLGISQLIFNMVGLYYFGTRIARTLGPLYLLKLYFAGALGSSVLFLSGHALMAILESEGIAKKDQSKPKLLLGADGSVLAITLVDIFLYPKVTTYFELMFRVPAMIGILTLGKVLVMELEGRKSTTMGSIQAAGGAMVAAIAWSRIRKGRFYY